MMEMMETKADELEEELEKFVVRTLKNAYNADGVFVVSNAASAMFAETLKAVVELRNGREPLAILDDETGF